MKAKKKKQQKETVVTGVRPPSKGAFLLSVILALIAWGVSLYLLRRHFQIDSGASLSDPCSAVFGKTCDETLESPLAVQFGIPLGGWGILYYSVLITLLLMARNAVNKNGIHPGSLAALLSIPALVISVFLMASMLLGNSAFCPLCAVIHVANLGLFFSLRAFSGTSIAENFSQIKQIPTILNAVIASLAVGIAVYLLSTFVVRMTPAASVPAPRETAESGSLYLSEQQFDIPINDADSYSGPLDAAVQLVVFSDFQCPACKNYAAVIHQWQKEYAHKICVVFKNFPLDRACNPIMTRDLHKRACEAAYAAEAARRQKEFWRYHDALFATDIDANPEAFETIARSLELDIERFESEKQSPSVQSKVNADIHLGVRLGVNSTPSLFLNQRRVLDQSPELVRYLIDQILARK